jgi:hypothetical protein
MSCAETSVATRRTLHAALKLASIDACMGNATFSPTMRTLPAAKNGTPLYPTTMCSTKITPALCTLGAHAAAVK